MYNVSNQVHVPASDLVMEPFRFFHVLSTYKIGYTFSPNFFLAAAVSSLEKQGVNAASPKIDLSNLGVIMCGGEANRTVTLESADKVLRAFGAKDHSIKAAYGLSEVFTVRLLFLNYTNVDVDLLGLLLQP